MFTAGILLVMAFILIMIKMKLSYIKRALKYDIFIDIVVTSLMAWLLAGTYSGMMAAIVGGLLFSLFLWLVKQFIGYETRTKTTCHTCGHTSKEWTPVNGKFQKLQVLAK